MDGIEDLLHPSILRCLSGIPPDDTQDGTKAPSGSVECNSDTRPSPLSFV